MGKSRKRRDFDRNARNQFAPRAQAALLERVKPPAMGQRPSPAALAVVPPLRPPPYERPALPLPKIPEPLVANQSVLALPARSKGKYPAKKAKRAKRFEPTAPCTAAAEPASNSTVQSIMEVSQPPEPLLEWDEVLGFTPWDVSFETPIVLAVAAPAIERDVTSEALALATAFAVSALYADEPEAKTSVEPPEAVAAAAGSADRRDADVKPLPRAQTVAVWKKNSPLDAIGYWLRARTRRLATLLTFGGGSRELARLRAENDALRRQLGALEAMMG